MNTRCAVVVFAVLAGFMVRAQESPLATFARQRQFNTSGIYTVETFSPPPSFVHPITGEPYSGRETKQTDRMLADGTHIRQEQPARKIFRDSKGRIRTEQSIPGLSPGAAREGRDLPLVVEITDPVAHVKYVVDTVNQVVHRQGFTAPGSANGWHSTSSSSRSFFQLEPPKGNGIPEIKEEKLGTQVIEGVTVEGTRRTTTWQVGTRGNDRPIIEVGETWASPEPAVIVLNKKTSPDSGNLLEELTNINRNEPEPALFQPPPAYRMVDEAGEFTIRWKVADSSLAPSSVSP